MSSTEVKNQNEIESLALLKELYDRFRVVEYAGLGPCLVIPEDKFEFDWDDLLTQITEVHENSGYVYVQLPKDMMPRKDSAIHEPSTASKKKKCRRGLGAKGPKWTPQEDKLLIAIANDKDVQRNMVYSRYVESCKDLGVPERSKASIKNRIDRLRKKGKIRYRISKNKVHEEPVKVHEEALGRPVSEMPQGKKSLKDSKDLMQNKNAR